MNRVENNLAHIYNGIEWVRTKGGAYEVGCQHGMAMKSLALYQYGQHLPHFHEPLTKEKKEQLCKRETWLKKEFPAEREEVEGIAVSIGENPLRVLLFCHQLGRRFPGPKDEVGACTGIVLRDTGLGPLCGNTLDDCGGYFVHVHEGSQWPKHAVIQLAGAAGGWGGMNEWGLYVANSSGGVSFDRPTPPPSPEHAVPSLMTKLLIVRYCRTVPEAVQMLKRPDILGHGHYLIADTDGHIAMVEKYSTDGPYEVPVHGSPFIMGNISAYDLHSDAERLRRENPPDPQNGDKWGRFESMKQLSANIDTPSIEKLQEILRSHYQALPEYSCSSVCNEETAVAMIGLPSEKRLMVAGRPPCQQHFIEINFSNGEVSICK